MNKIILSCLWLLSLGLCLYGISYSAVVTAQTTLGPTTLSSRVAIIQQNDFPRLMGMNIADDSYQLASYQSALAELDVVILGFYPGWNKINSNEPIRDAVRAIKEINPNILIGQYTNLTEAYNNLPEYAAWSYKSEKLDEENWWLRDANGNQVQWTSIYNTWMVNYTSWTNPDSNGLRYPQWLAGQDYSLYFQPVPEFDIWYFDNVVTNPRIAAADWKLDGNNYSNTDPVIQQAVRAGAASEWAVSKKLAPNVLMLGNSDNDLNYPEYTNKLNAAFLEGLMGKSWSYETVDGWDYMMLQYQSIFPNLLAPKLVGFNVWGDTNDYQFFRYAFASCLMDNGFFSFTDNNVGYASVPWFDEYNVNLGLAVDTPQQVQVYQGVHMRRFTNGLALVNPTSQSIIVPVSPGYQRILGSQDPITNNGKAVVGSVSLAPKSGLILVK